MDAFDKFWFQVRRFFFPVLLIVAGLVFVAKGLGVDKATGLSQSPAFLYGGVAVLILGGVGLAFVAMKKIPTALLLGLSVLLLGGTYLFVSFNYNSINDQIIYENEVEESENLAKQGLMDIQKLQEAYERKYQKFAASFDSLVYFAKYDSISVLTKAEGDVPTRPMTMDEAKQLGLRNPKEVMNEEDAIALGIIIREYNKVPVAEYLFSEEKLKKDIRAYDFNIDKLADLRTIDSTAKSFNLQVAEIDSAVWGVKISAVPPYGPQKEMDIKDTLHIGSLTETKMNQSW